jgi:hypothetical protein
MSQLDINFGNAYPLTKEEAEVIRLLKKGRANAISMTELATLINVSTRRLQDIIKHLIEDHCIFIGSTCGKQHGYWLPTDEEDYRAAVDQLKHRIISLARRIRAIDKQAFQEIFGQGSFTEL